MILTFISVMLVFANAAPVSEDKNLELWFSNKVTGAVQTEFGEHFEGDMILTEEQKTAVSEATGARNGLKGGAKRWPDNTVIFHIDEDDFDEEEVKTIKEAMADIASKSCIKFRPRERDEHAVVIEGTGNGCYSNVGHTTIDDSGEAIPSQVLNLKPPSCVKLGTIVHEMLHTLGFYHMQSTYDRDEFVKIEWENIKSGTEHNFAKYNNDTVTDFGVEYDYGSVMHYPEHAFSKNGNKTIIPLKVYSTKLLGSYIDGVLTWETHIEELCGKLSRSCFALWRLASTATCNVVRFCYFATVHNNITYGLELWGRAADRNRAFGMQKKAYKLVKEKECQRVTY